MSAPVHDLVRRLLTADRTGALLSDGHPAERRQSEAELMRQALRRLAERPHGNADTSAGSPTSPFQPDDTQQIMETLTATAISAARLAAEQATDSHLRDLTAKLRATETALAHSSEVPSQLEFLETLALATNDPDAESDLFLLNDLLRLAHPAATEQLTRNRQAWRHYCALLRALIKRDAAAAEKAVTAWLGRAERAIRV